MHFFSPLSDGMEANTWHLKKKIHWVGNNKSKAAHAPNDQSHFRWYFFAMNGDSRASGPYHCHSINSGRPFPVFSCLLVQRHISPISLSPWQAFIHLGVSFFLFFSYRNARLQFKHQLQHKHTQLHVVVCPWSICYGFLSLWNITMFIHCAAYQCYASHESITYMHINALYTYNDYSVWNLYSQSNSLCSTQNAFYKCFFCHFPLTESRVLYRCCDVVFSRSFSNAIVCAQINFHGLPMCLCISWRIDRGNVSVNARRATVLLLLSPALALSYTFVYAFDSFCSFLPFFPISIWNW